MIALLKEQNLATLKIHYELKEAKERFMTTAINYWR